jgi:CubicO group peptidase (beta-lactamase class C family)
MEGMGVNADRTRTRSPMRDTTRARGTSIHGGGDAPAPPAEAPGVTPERVQNALARLDDLVQQTLDRTKVPGMAVAVVHGDETPYLKGFGTREAGRDLPVDPDTVFQIASMSKPIAATVVAGLVGDGTVSWDSKLYDLDPGFALRDAWVTSQVTLRDMFCHRSGLPDHGGDLLEDIGYDRAEILHRLRFIEPACSFRSGYFYTNFGLTAATVAAANAAEMTWEELAARRLYAPLGMTRTSSRFADYMAAPNRALPHMRANGGWGPTRQQRDPDAQSPAGGVSSTVRDLTRWMHLQIGKGTFAGKEIVAAALGETHQPQIVSQPAKDPDADRASFYGLGWGVGYTDDGGVRISHSGAFELGAGTAVYIYPGSRLGITVLTNASPIGAAETVALQFLDLAERGAFSRDWPELLTHAYQEINAPTYGTAVDYGKPPASPTASLPIAAYAGSFHNELYGELVVAGEGEELSLRLGPALRPYPLTHYDRDVFTYQPRGENAYGPSAVTFLVGADGRAGQVTIENLDQHGQGTFDRLNTT